MNRDQFSAAGLHFLEVELETGNTFISMAQKAGDNHEKAMRDRANGRKAYDTIVHFLSRVTLTPAEEMRWHEQLAAMKAALVGLGEVFD